MGRNEGQNPHWLEAEGERIDRLRGQARLEAMWNVIGRLGSEGSLDAEIEWLIIILDSASHEASLDYTFRAFSELRRIYATDSRYADLREHVLWYYKWLVDALPYHADIPMQTIEQVFADMEACYRTEGESLRPVYSLRCQASILMGQRDQAPLWYEKWENEPEGKSDDCQACTLDRKILYMLEFDRFDEALTIAEPLLSGEIYCNDTPTSLTRLVGPALHLQNEELAAWLLRTTVRSVRRVPSMLSALAAHVPYTLMLGAGTRSFRLLLVALRRVRDVQNDIHRFNVYRACGLWAALALLGGIRDRYVPLRLLPGSTGLSGQADLPQVASLCFDEAQRIALRLDHRNQTTRYIERLRDMEQTIRRSVEERENPPETTDS